MATHKAHNNQNLCKQVHHNQFRGRRLLSLPTPVYKKFFEGADEHWYVTRQEFGDGSCFFHSLATLLNLHTNPDTTGDPMATQKKVLHNIKNRIRMACNHTDVTGCFDFMHNDYSAVTEPERKQLGHHLRKFVLEAVDAKWDNFWRKKTSKQPHLLNRVYGKGRVRDMLRDNSVWADVYIIMFVMHVLNLNILFFDEKRSSIYCGVHGERMHKQPTVFILWVNNSHFQPILRLSCDRAGKHHIQGLFRYNQDNIVNQIFNKWKHQEQCHVHGGLENVLL